MLFGFIGSPCSGKTTTAVAVFSMLKNMGFACELVLEQARLYIANLRYQQNLDPEEPVILTDSDQIRIMEKQNQIEKTLIKSCGPSVIIVSDSSSLNSLAYMSAECRDSEIVQKLIPNALKNYTFSFYSTPIQSPAKAPKQFDPNRIHDESSSKNIDLTLLELLQKIEPKIPYSLTSGSIHQRSQFVLSEIINRALTC